MSPNRAVIAAALATALAAGVVVWFALSVREGPARCPDGLWREAARCCGRGQTSIAGRCTGSAQGCGSGQHVDSSGGCTRSSRKVRLQAEFFAVRGPDWEGSRDAAPPPHTRSFQIDSVEVSGERYTACVAAGVCTRLSAPEVDALGLPVRHVTPEQAKTYCGWVGGRLPTGGEWQVAAAGRNGRRYPWGNTGLVCRRAVFGLANGPCAQDGTSPDAPGSRPEGATPEGVFDLAGNVAEWTLEPGGGVSARGGSYLSTGAAALKSWAAEARTQAAPDIGFRCAYSAKGAASR